MGLSATFSRSRCRTLLILGGTWCWKMTEIWILKDPLLKQVQGLKCFWKWENYSCKFRLSCRDGIFPDTSMLRNLILTLCISVLKFCYLHLIVKGIPFYWWASQSRRCSQAQDRNPAPVYFSPCVFFTLCLGLRIFHPTLEFPPVYFSPCVFFTLYFGLCIFHPVYFSPCASPCVFFTLPWNFRPVFFTLCIFTLSLALRIFHPTLEFPPWIFHPVYFSPCVFFTLCLALRIFPPYPGISALDFSPCVFFTLRIFHPVPWTSPRLFPLQN